MCKFNGQTAKARRGASAPLRWLIEDCWVCGNVLDYGCGRGADVDALRVERSEQAHPRTGVRYAPVIEGWDPAHQTEPPSRGTYETVLCTYVLNVIESADERVEVLRQLEARVDPDFGMALVTVRRDIPRGGTPTQFWVDDEIVARPGWRSLHKTSKFEIYLFNPQRLT